MGTKNNPGSYDCYAKADPDEPMFILLGRDWSAHYLVSLWIALRMGDPSLLLEASLRAIRDPKFAMSSTPPDQIREANTCVWDMKRYYDERSKR